MKAERLRWKLWHFVTRFKSVCPSNAHSVLLYGDRRDVRIDDMCRRDLAANGVCWCGKLRDGSVAAVSEKAGESALEAIVDRERIDQENL